MAGGADLRTGLRLWAMQSATVSRCGNGTILCGLVLRVSSALQNAEMEHLVQKPKLLIVLILPATICRLPTVSTKGFTRRTYTTAGFCSQWQG